MEIPALPTDNAYKFLAVGSLFICIACFIGAFQLQQSALKYQSAWAEKILDNPSATKTLAKDYAIPGGPFPKAESGIPEPIRHLIDVKWEPAEEETFFSRALWVNGVLFQVIFLVCMIVWFRYQQYDEALAILELRQRAQRAGLKINIELPKRFRA